MAFHRKAIQFVQPLTERCINLLVLENKTYWKRFFILPERCTQDKWMKMFQFITLHRILATNEKLKLHIKDSELRDYCLLGLESIERLVN